MLSDLGIGKTIIAVTPMKTGIARCLPFAETAEERLKCSFYPEHNILQDLAVDLSVFGHRFFDVWYFCPLLVVGDGHAALVPGFATLPDGGVIEVAAEYEGTPKYPLLFKGGLELVLVGFADALRHHEELFCLIGHSAASMGTIYRRCRGPWEPPNLHPPASRQALQT
jgi:hypothetical protein